jgi:putative endonuclease
VATPPSRSTRSVEINAPLAQVDFAAVAANATQALPLHVNANPAHRFMLQWLVNKFLAARADAKAGSLGERGENVAAKYLTQHGYRVLQRNYRSKLGEIDIVARQGRVLVFVEVKTRTDAQPRPEDQVNLEKQNQITKAANLYLNRFGFPQPPARFDVIAIVWPEGRDPQIQHHQNAFDATF